MQKSTCITVNISTAITGQGLDQRSYNPVRDTVFGENELLYSGAEILVSAGTTAAASKALTSTTQRLPVPREVEVKPNVVNGAEEIKAVTKNGCETSLKFSPVNPGHLEVGVGIDVTESFRGATYIKKVLTEDTVMYRVYGGKAEKVGRYLTKTPQGAGLQSQLDLALNPSWGNTTENVTKVVVPKGTVIYEGSAAPQNIYDSLGNIIGELPGGGNQIYIPYIKEEWFK